MFEALGLGHLWPAFEEDPMLFYKQAVQYAFLQDMRNSATNSLRRCVSALGRCTEYRRTPEFDNLIDLGGISQ